MEENRKKKFVCKFCHKRFLCGKALGGHIRSHDYECTIVAEEAKIDKIDSKRDLGDESGGVQSGYVLRENPIKSMRFSDLGISTVNQEKVCKECGKGFSSLKALCGHMACHSEKEKTKVRKNGFKDHSTSGGNLKLEIDDQSDTETSGPGGQRRSKRLRYKNIGVYSSQFSLSNGSSASDVKQEQEEVAISLMMLSRDFSYRGCLDSVVESSENHSVTLDAKSSSTDTKIDSKNGFNCGTNGNEFVAMKRTRDGNFKGSELVLSENSDSGYFRNGPGKADSDVSIDGFRQSLKIKNPNGKFSQFEDSYDEMGKSLINYKCKKFEFLEKDLIGEEGYEEVDRASMKRDSRNRVKHEYESLGGQRGSQSKISGFCGSMNESSENSIVDEYVPAFMGNITAGDSNRNKMTLEKDLSDNVENKIVSKKGKEHECPICFRVFQSNQALGGHKRSHFAGGSEDRTVLIEQEAPEMHCLIDLNLPAPIEEEAYMP